ncbi:ABC transporter substrate-binding protein [Actinophytocola sp.]|uniref:ABC transporter substrate-binding protein n=1 Tax=Actinophytocola sp. TaxID=1872138 RepID=UPI003D6BEFF7
MLRKTALLCLGTLVACLTACGDAEPAAGDGPVRLVVAQGSTNFTYSSIYVAQGKGFFADEGLEIDLQTIGGAPTILNGVFGGNIDIGLPGTSGAVTAAGQGRPVKIIGNLSVGASTSIVFGSDFARAKGITESSSDEDKIEALADARIASSIAGSTTTSMLTYFLKSRGVDPSGPQILPFNDQGALLAAVRSGSADALCFGPSVAQKAVADGFAVPGLSLAKAPELADVSWTSIVVSSSWLEENAETARKFVRAVSRALELISERPDEAKPLVREELPDLTDPVFDGAWAEELATLPATPEVREKNISSLVPVLNETDSLPDPPRFEDLVSNDYLP